MNNDFNKQGSGNGLKLVFYVLSLTVAFLAGVFYERPKAMHPQTDAIPDATLSAAPAAATPSIIPVASATPAAPAPVAPAPAITHVAPATHSPTPGLINAGPAAIRVEKAVAVTTSAPATTTSSAPAAVPIKSANDVTITEPVEIPVKQGAKIVGYINLQKGQVVTPIAVEKDQIKIKSGEGFVMVPVKSTDMVR